MRSEIERTAEEYKRDGMGWRGRATKREREVDIGSNDGKLTQEIEI